MSQLFEALTVVASIYAQAVIPSILVGATAFVLYLYLSKA